MPEERGAGTETNIGVSDSFLLNPFTAKPVKIPGWKVPTYTPPNSILDGPIATLLSILCILIKIFSRAHTEGGEKSFMISNLASIGLFPSDGAAMMAVKGLRAATLFWLLNARAGVPRTQKLRSPLLRVCYCQRLSPLKLGVGQNKTVHASSTARDSACFLIQFSLIFCQLSYNTN